MAVSLSPIPFFLFRGKSHPDQCKDTRDTERRISTGINSGDLGPVCFREPTTLEMANSIGRHCTLLDKYDYAVATRYR